MAKHGKKKVSSKADTQEIVKLRDFQDAEASFEYEEDEKSDEERLKKAKVPKAVYRVSLILLVLILGLVVWINRASLTPENIWNWVKVQVMGTGVGDGFPVQITGSNVYDSNFLSGEGSAVVLSDTSFTMLNSSGRELLSLRHSLSEPALKAGYGKYLLYNAGSTGYMVLSGTKTERSANSDKEILAGTVTQNGRYALGVQGSDSASELNVYLKDGSLQYNYLFAKDYITAVALNYDGTFGAVCTVRSEKGEMVSKITVFDFGVTEPIAEYEARNNLLLDIYWAENNSLYAVGDSAVVTAKASDYVFTEYGYDGRQLTAYRMDAGRAYISISAYEHAGPSTLLVFHGSDSPVKIEAEERIVSLSVSGGTVGALIDGNAVFYDYSTGLEQGRTAAGSDAKSIALGSERMAYVLGVSEIRTVEIK